MRKENPGKTFYALAKLADCPDMKLGAIEKMVWAIEDMAPEVTVPEPTAAKARSAIEKMLAIG